jgi:hypothetical protein
MRTIVAGLQPTILATFAIGTPAFSIRDKAVCLKTLAQKIEDKRRRALEEGAWSIKKAQAPRLLSVAADEWLEMKKASLAPRSVAIERANLAHLLPELGRKLLCDIEAQDVAIYQAEATGQ